MGQTAILDVRLLGPKERYPKIFETFDGIKAGEILEVVSDHDPRPLYYQFLHERAGQFRWGYLEEGPEVWKVAIRRVADGTGEKDGFPVVLSGNHKPGKKPEWINQLNPAFEVFLDVRPMMENGLEPLPVIVNMAKDLRDRQYLHLVDSHEKTELYEIMAKLGFDHFTECRGGVCNIYFKRIPERKTG